MSEEPQTKWKSSNLLQATERHYNKFESWMIVNKIGKILAWNIQTRQLDLEQRNIRPAVFTISEENIANEGIQRCKEATSWGLTFSNGIVWNMRGRGINAFKSSGWIEENKNVSQAKQDHSQIKDVLITQQVSKFMTDFWNVR